jgi:hypothetical protein
MEIFMRSLLRIIGLAAFLMGLLWIAQGTGTLTWPASSFMNNQMQWAYYGAGLALIGMALIVSARRR